MLDVVNDALGLAQYITQHLDQEEATLYLVAIEGLSVADWKKAKENLPEVVSSNRQTKEATIKDIVSVFSSKSVTTRYLIANLGLLPGLQPAALALASYTASTLRAVKCVAEGISDHSKKQRDVDSTRVHLSETTSSSFQQRGESPKAQLDSYSSALRRQLPSKQDKRNKSVRSVWTVGSHCALGDTQTPQLKYICLALKSGPEETVETLTTVFKQWQDLRDVKIEAFSKTHHNTLFRVQLTTPAAILQKWTTPSTWPSRISVKQWIGNPKLKLTPIQSRTYKKKIYVGNLSPGTNMTQIQTNMKKVYHDEIQSGTIANIEAYLNEPAWARQQQLTAQNVNHVARKSCCVVMTSHPGKSLSEVDLKLETYDLGMRRSIRYWNGPIPWPKDHEARKFILNLQW